jgi:hypothetical protein
MWRIYGSKSDYLNAPRLETQRQWIRYQAEQQYEQEKQEQIEKKQREEFERNK